MAAVMNIFFDAYCSYVVCLLLLCKLAYTTLFNSGLFFSLHTNLIQSFIIISILNVNIILQNAYSLKFPIEQKLKCTCGNIHDVVSTRVTMRNDFDRKRFRLLPLYIIAKSFCNCSTTPKLSSMSIT